MTSEKQRWIAEDAHNGPALRDTKHDPRAGSGIEIATPLSNEDSAPKYGVPQPPESEAPEATLQPQPENRPVYLSHSDTERPRVKDSNWHFSFWQCCTPGSLGIESICCPCVLAGRTHQHLHNPQSAGTHIPSTNWYCTNCCLVSLFLLVGMPFCALMGSTQRREVRYKYNIKGDNCNDCAVAVFCYCCALVQEEKEVVWRMQQELEAREGNGGAQMETRGEVMRYASE